MPFYIVQYEDEFDTGLPMGYQVVAYENEDEVPAGAVTAKDEKALQKITDAADKANEKLIDDGPNESPDEFDPKAGEPMRSDALKMGKFEFKKKYRIKHIRVLAESLGLNSRGREAVLVNQIYEKLGLK